MTIDRRDYYSPAQVKKLCEYCQNAASEDMRYGRVNAVRAWMLVDLALSTGLRRSEMCDLCVKDINFDEKWILVRRRKKKKLAEDVIPLPDKLSQHLKEYLDYFKIAKGPILCTQKGQYTPDALYRLWSVWVKRAGLRHLRLHGSRHTLATQMQRKYGNLRMVQKQLGHTNVQTTAQFYADVPFEDQQKAANGLWE